MKHNVKLLMLCLISFFFSCHGPFDVSKCVVEGVLTSGFNPCMSDPCLPGMELWIITENKSYVIADYWICSSEEIVVGTTTAHCGDAIKAYGTSRSYYDHNGDMFSEISIDSLVLLSPLKETIDGFNENNDNNK